MTESLEDAGGGSVCPNLIFRRAFKSVLKEFEIEQKTISENSAMLAHLYPEQFVTVYRSNLSKWINNGSDLYGQNIETLIFCLLFPPHPKAFKRFFELAAAGFDQNLALRAMQKWEQDLPESLL